MNAHHINLPFHMKLSCIYIIIIPLCGPCLSFRSSAASNTADRSPLLSFKNSISDDPHQALASWNGSVHYCQWQGVTCSRRHTNRVTALVLHSLNLTGQISPSLGNLSFLQNLNLSSNSLQGTIPQSFSQLSRIKVIDLKGNKLQGGIPSNLSSCRNLKILRISNNQLVGEVPAELGFLPKLVYIDLGGNSLGGGIPSSLGNLSSLFAIDLSQNNFFGPIPSTFGKLTSLSFLYLYRNSLVGGLPHFDNFSSLAYLDLSYNNLSGSVPPSLGNLSSLVKIDFTVNMLSGSIPSSLCRLPNLVELYLTGNSLSGPIPPSLGSLSSLIALGLSHNELNGEVPPSLYNLSTLQLLGLADNQLVGTLPKNIGHTLQGLQGIYLYYNNFHGSLPMSLANASQLSDIEMTGNRFSGTIPSNLGNLQNLYWLSLDRNQFEARDAEGWSFLASLANCSRLQSLGLDYNGLGGVLPKSVANLSASLQWLALGGNQLYGSIPGEIENLVNLNVLGMDANFLSGSIPATIGRLHRLQELYLSENKFSGTIPGSLGDLTDLNKLGMGSNAFEGSIPSKLGDCQALRWLNLSYNQLTGTIPKEVVSISSLTEFVDLSHNSLSGSLPSEVGRLKNLVQLYVSGNNLSGEIPPSIGECQLLNTLHMDGNHFQGIIPSSMSNLKGIQELDLSRNKLSGPIPKFIENFTFLKYLNLSFNDFEGEVPTRGIFQNSTAISLVGNAKLCGGDPKLNLPTCTNTGKERRGGSPRIKQIITITIASLCAILLICLLGFWYWSRNKRMKHPSTTSMEDGNNLTVSYSDICKATDEFSPSNLIGTGSFGSVYKGTLHFGEEKIVAIKVLNLQRKGASKSFIAECQALRSVRHRNLLKILTVCSTLDRKGNEFKALLFEYMANGSLEEWLHTGGEKLSLEQRLNIAIDVASALDYLHHHGPTPIVHCDLKPSNILLDDNMTAHVGDFGLAKFLTRTTEKSSDSSVGVKGTVGYVAPEYGTSNKVSTHGDVYSYGILVLEMFTGVKPTDDALKEGLNLHKVVEMALPTQVMDIVDPCLMVREGEAGVQDCLVSILRIGLSCSQESPRERMQMGDAIRQMDASRDAIKRMEAIRERCMGIGIQEKKNKKEQMENEGPSSMIHR